VARSFKTASPRSAGRNGSFGIAVVVNCYVRGSILISRFTFSFVAPLRSYSENANRTFPGTPFWNPVNPDVTNSMPFVTVTPADPIDPPWAVTPFTV
jgi:hypothetical protein